MSGPNPPGAARQPACSRCGRTAPPGAGPFCPYCGRYLAALVWVAETPPSARRPVRTSPRPPYGGPPRYAFVPRWGFPRGRGGRARRPRRRARCCAPGSR
ncbi:hypothetical protein [Pseudonocardia sp. T1-2H]|uniref:hypothetical protein n=1 Tax=Pseudonocardia sp. T1-2H TaxID=3128899 RepID=UPI003100BF9B